MILQTKSVTSRIAKINNHLQPGSEPARQPDPIGQKLEASKGLLGKYYYLFSLLQSSGARFSEVQDIKHNEIAMDGQCLIRGRKRSKDRVIQNQVCTRYLQKCRLEQIDPFVGCNIFTASRILKNLGIMKQKKGREKLTVTGVFRDEYAKSVRSVQRKESTLTESIGHKSAQNDNYYGRD